MAKLVTHNLLYRCGALVSKLLDHDDSKLEDYEDMAKIVMEFVMAEKGRAGAPELEEALPLVLYFSTNYDRDEFIELFHEAKPGAIARKIG